MSEPKEAAARGQEHANSRIVWRILYDLQRIHYLGYRRVEPQRK
jgi:hypothetical protein